MYIWTMQGEILWGKAKDGDFMRRSSFFSGIIIIGGLDRTKGNYKQKKFLQKLAGHWPLPKASSNCILVPRERKEHVHTNLMNLDLQEFDTWQAHDLKVKKDRKRWPRFHVTFHINSCAISHRCVFWWFQEVCMFRHSLWTFSCEQILCHVLLFSVTKET